MGPLLFLIFINDLQIALNNLESKLFADDSTFYSSGSELDKLILKFSSEIDNLLEWCVESKTVSEFKLLGCTIDNKLTFSKQVASICSSINRK